MAINVGLDFGTHQTKVCIEDSSDKKNKRYSIFTFKNLEGENEICLPSRIQINKDLTVSYGFYNPDDCYIFTPQPTIEEPEYKPLPVLQLPEEPEKPYSNNPEAANNSKDKSIPTDWKDDLLSLWEKLQKINVENTKNKKSQSIAQLQKKHDNWEAKCEKIRLEFEKSLEEVKNYNKKLRENYENIVEEQTRPQRWEFYYFKQAVFTSNNQTFYINPTLLSIWYIAYILFMLEEKYGNTFSIQMGVPSDFNNHKELKDRATNILVQAYKLVEEVFHNDFSKFLSTKYTELIDLTPSTYYKYKEKFEYGINVFPEACAALEAIAECGTVREGRFHLLVDIGGGTTDISFFNIPEKKELRVFGFTSVNLGINYINEKCCRQGNVFKYEDLKDSYWIEINKVVKNLWEKLNSSFEKTGFDRQRLLDAAKDNVCLYSGGGSTLVATRGIFPFNDDRKMDESILPIKNIIINERVNIHPIMANAFGLAHARVSDELSKLAMFDTIFGHLSKNKDDNHGKIDYSLLDHR